MKLEVGRSYLCIRTVFSVGGYITYEKDSHYTCEVEGCLTNKNGNINHIWPNDDTFFKYFRDIKAHRKEMLEEILWSY